MTDTTDTAALVERLRRYATALWHYEAADTIERQAARIAALEEGLNWIVDMPLPYNADQAHDMRTIARRALKGGRDDR